ncbi:sensor histidine kinase [Miltoncostaea marina]|uniref:sensor histidine kinase n=1 Tax=Miltoncostaea marina TaxID=2843215 RepID=UPI001C3E6D84|nr:sensor histidine kinase [Miltoncostaea marina]
MDGGAGVPAAVARALADAPDPLAAVPAALAAIAAGAGADAAALYLAGPPGGPSTLAGAVGAAVETGRWTPPGSIGDAGPPGVALTALRAAGREVGRLALPADASTPPADVLAAALALALAAREAGLAAGVADRLRELDRQAREAAALARIARLVGAQVEEGAVAAGIAREARDLLGAAAAVVRARDAAGRPRELAREGAGDAAAAEVSLPGGTGDEPAGTLGAGGLPARMGPAEARERLGALAETAGAALAAARERDRRRRERADRRALATATVAAQEEERRRIAQELHDGPVQELVGLGLLLDALAAEVGGALPGAAADAEAAAAAAREAVRGLRRAIADIHPLSLAEQGLEGAVRAQCRRLEALGVEVTVDLAAAGRLEPLAQTAAFRIVQEALANVARHAGAGTVAITARARGGAVELEVRDDGRGFDASRPLPGAADGHLGLAAVRERAVLLGGSLAIASAPGEGTRVTVRLPAGVPAGAQPGSESRSSAAASAVSSAKRSSTTT